MEKNDELTKNQVRYLTEGIGAIRDVLLGNQKNYVRIYREKDFRLCN